LNHVLLYAVYADKTVRFKPREGIWVRSPMCWCRVGDKSEFKEETNNSSKILLFQHLQKLEAAVLQYTSIC